MEGVEGVEGGVCMYVHQTHPVSYRPDRRRPLTVDRDVILAVALRALTYLTSLTYLQTEQ